MAEESRKYNYEKEMGVPIKLIKKNPDKPKIKKSLGSLKFKQILKNAGRLIVILSLISAPVYLISAFEAHVVNVTAHICKPSCTYTIGFWKNHPNIYQYCLPQTLGDIEVTNEDEVNLIFANADSSDMIDMLKGQLLAMKFNIACSGIDADEGEEFEGKTLEQIVAEADEMLINYFNYTREELEAMKNLLDCLNNKEYIKYCSTPPSWFVDGFGSLAKTTEENEETSGDDSSQELLLAKMNLDNSGDSTNTEATTTEATTTEATTTEESLIIDIEPVVEEPPAEEPPPEEPPAEEPPPEETSQEGESSTEEGSTDTGSETGSESETTFSEETSSTESTEGTSGDSTGESTESINGESTSEEGTTSEGETQTDGGTDGSDTGTDTGADSGTDTGTDTGTTDTSSGTEGSGESSGESTSDGETSGTEQTSVTE